MTRRFVSEAIYALQREGFKAVRTSPLPPHVEHPALIAYQSGGPAIGLYIQAETVDHYELETAMLDAKLERLRVSVAELFNEAVDERQQATAEKKTMLRAVANQLDKALTHIDLALDRIERK